MGKYLVVALGGAVGTVARYWVGGMVGRALPSRFPFGTLIINVTGSFIIGFFLTLVTERISINPNLRLAIAVGFVGGYTTFSTFEYESFKLLEGGSGIAGFMNVALSLMLGFLAVWGGVAMARSFDKPAAPKAEATTGRLREPRGLTTVSRRDDTKVSDEAKVAAGLQMDGREDQSWKARPERS